MNVFGIIAICLAAVIAMVNAGEHEHAVAGDFAYKVEVKHPSYVAGDHKGHHTFVEDKGVQEQYIKVGVYPHVETHGHGYGHEEVHEGYGYHQ